ncbi:MAG: hypothetical protein L6Q95_01530 [Planctomycetes bacterium]|nr:hypothetical protein [Planctomycetota bacterium]
MLAFEVTGPQCAEVLVAVEHRDGTGSPWSCAGSLTALAPALAELMVSALKDEARLRFDVVRGTDGALVEVRALPPRWIPS